MKIEDTWEIVGFKRSVEGGEIRARGYNSNGGLEFTFRSAEDRVTFAKSSSSED